MKIIGAVVLLGMAVTSAAAADKRAARFTEGLKKLDPETRLEQVCDYEAMRRIGREAKEYKPDRSQANAVSEPKHDGSTLIAKGAAFRSKASGISSPTPARARPTT